MTKEDSKKKDNKKSGIKAVLDHSLQSYDKLPMLEIIFEKFITQLSTALRNLTSEAVDVSIDNIKSLRFEDYFKSHNTPLSIIVFKAVEWSNLGLLVLENNTILSFIDLLLGGKGAIQKINLIQKKHLHQLNKA